MDELRVKDEVSIVNKNKNLSKLKGYVKCVEYDRFYVKIDDIFCDILLNFDELDELDIVANTHMGLKKSTGAIIDVNYNSKIITIENNPTIKTTQKRKFVRVVADFDIKIAFNNEIYKCKVKNISSSGIAISTEKEYFKLSDSVELVFPEEIFTKEIKCNAKIVKMNDLNYALRYDNLNKHDEDRIMKFVFNEISKRKNH